MVKKKSKKLDSHEIENICEYLIDSVKSNSIDQQKQLLKILEKDCKNYLAAFSVIGDDDLAKLIDENEVWWFQQEFHNYEIESASNALSAVFEIRRLMQEKDDLREEFDSLLKNALSEFEKHHNKARLQEIEASAAFNEIHRLRQGRKVSKRARGIFELYIQHLEKDPDVSHDILIKRITDEIKKNERKLIKISFPDGETYTVSLDSECNEDFPFVQKPERTDEIKKSEKNKSPKKITLYTEYYLPIKKHLTSKID